MKKSYKTVLILNLVTLLIFLPNFSSAKARSYNYGIKNYSYQSTPFKSYNYSLGQGTGSKFSSEKVSGYIKSNGTYVNSYRRSSKDNNLLNNWTTKPNSNPYTGKIGSKLYP